MSQQTDSSGSSSKSVSIASGSLLLIGVMLWFFTSGLKTDLNNLRKEVGELKAMLESQSKDLATIQSKLGEVPQAEPENDGN